MDKSEQFHHYFLKHPESLLVKLLGVFKFERLDVDKDPIHLVIMKNLSMSHKSTNLRVYDIKGSQFNRSALKELKIKEGDEEKLRKNTLKDKDFAVLEKTVRIEQSKAQKIK